VSRGCGTDPHVPDSGHWKTQEAAAWRGKKQNLKNRGGPRGQEIEAQGGEEDRGRIPESLVL